MTDEVLIEFLRCGALNFQYALHTTQEEKQPLSESSLRRFRRRLEADNATHHCDLVKEEFERISKQMAVDMGILHGDPNSGEDDSAPIIVRMDSMELEAYAKAMTRIEILYTANVIILRYLLKKGLKASSRKKFPTILKKGIITRSCITVFLRTRKWACRTAVLRKPSVRCCC